MYYKLRDIASLRSWQDFVRECFCFGSEAVNASGEAVRGLVKSRVEFLPGFAREKYGGLARSRIPPATQAKTLPNRRVNPQC